MTLNASMGLRIADLRKKNNMTQEQLAEKLDISIKHCSSVERGLSRLSYEKLIDVSNIFDVSLDYLLKGESIDARGLDFVHSTFPNFVISVMTSDDEKEIHLLQEYLRLYTKLRTTQHKESESN